MQSCKRITLQYSFTYGYQVKFTLDAHFLQEVPTYFAMSFYPIIPNYKKGPLLNSVIILPYYYRI